MLNRIIRQYKLEGKVDRFKVRLVAKSFEQKLGIDYFQVFRLVAKLDTIHMIIFLTYLKVWKTHQMDVKLTFLNGVIQQEVFVEQPLRYIKEWKEK